MAEHLQGLLTGLASTILYLYIDGIVRYGRLYKLSLGMEGWLRWAYLFAYYLPQIIRYTAIYICFFTIYFYVYLFGLYIESWLVNLLFEWIW